MTDFNTSERVERDGLIVSRVLHYFQNLDCVVEPQGEKTGMTKEDALEQLHQDLYEHYQDWREE